MQSALSKIAVTIGRSWFALALGLLLLVAIPGVALFALTLLGWEGRANDWLKGVYKITYHFPLAWWIALILILVPVAIALLYFLKLKRKPLSVPSTFLWRKSIEDLHVNALFQWLRQNLLLLLQLLAAVLLIYAFMDFRVHGRTEEGKHYILVLDNSASMGATDVSPSRLHWAKQEAAKEIDAATDNDFGMIIVFNSTAEILQSYTNNRGQLRAALDRIEQTQRQTHIEEALSLAASLANPTRSTDDSSVRPANVEPGKERTYVAPEGIATEVHVFSDGRFPDLPDFALENLSVHFHSAGKPGPASVDNVAIVTFSALRDDQDSSKLQVFTRVMNFRNESVGGNAKLQLEVLINGQLKGIKEQPLAIKPREVITLQEAAKDEPVVRDTPGEQVVTFELTDLDDRASVVLHARLAGITDKLPLDDEAWISVGVVRKAKILVVGPPNEILSAFFDDDATREVADTTRLPAEDLQREAYQKPARNGDYDLVIFDRCAPAKEEEMPRSNTMFIGYPPPPWKRDAVTKISNPQIKGWAGSHPVMRYLAALHQIGIAEAFALKNLPPRTPRLMEIDQNNILLFALSRHSFTDLVLTFPILNEKEEWNTNWPLLPSFPLFLRNVLYTLGNVSDGSSEESMRPGQVKTLRPDQAVDQIEVTDPVGNVRRLSRGTRSDFSYGETNQVGIYRVAWNGTMQRTFAVNLLDPEESNIEPRTAIHIGPRAVEGTRERSQPRELWKWFVLAALALLLTEWYIYNRRVYV
jgi:hypothetical protein